MGFKILDLFSHTGHLVVKVEHYHPDGSRWFIEHYVWQGREAFKHKRETNARGELLQADGTVAPTRVKQGGAATEIEQYLEEGKSWKLRPGPHMDESSILNIISSIHRQRQKSGWPEGAPEWHVPSTASSQDEAGAPLLTLHFQGLKGRIAP